MGKAVKEFSAARDEIERELTQSSPSGSNLRLLSRSLCPLSLWRSLSATVYRSAKCYDTNKDLRSFDFEEFDDMEK
jgi:hypothetical protein